MKKTPMENVAADSSRDRERSRLTSRSWFGRAFGWRSRLFSRTGDTSGDGRGPESVGSASPDASDSSSQWPDPTVRAMMLAAAERKAASSNAGDLDVRGTDVEIPHLNQALPQYEILGVLGHGGQGVVYRAVQKSTGRVCALKVQHFDPNFCEKRQQRFEREVTLISRLNHPNVVTIFDSGMVSGRPYLSMELVDGLTIDNYMVFHRPTVEKRVALFETVCRAVASVHQHGVIHRDLKPSNIRVDLEGVPHILDFGLAKRFDDDVNDRSVSTVGQVIGTLPFLSPEQVRAESDTVDTRTDIYALGLILHLLLTGRMPYSVEGSFQSVVYNILNATPKRLDRPDGTDARESTCGPISADLSHVVLKALAKEKGRRYQSADALADDLRRCINGEPVTARGDNGLYLLRKTARRYRVHAAVGGAFVALLTAFAVTTTVLWQQADENAKRYQAAFLARSYVQDSREAYNQSNTDEAIQKCLTAIEIGERITDTNFDVLFVQYCAHKEISDYYLSLPGRRADSKRHLDHARKYASLMQERYPNRHESLRALAQIDNQDGRLAIREDQPLTARVHFEQACAGTQALLAHGFDVSPADRERFEDDYVLLRHNVARTYFKSEDRGEGLRLLREIFGELEQKCKAHPDNLKMRFRLVTTQALIGQCLLYGRTPAENELAWEECVSAEEKLDAIYLSEWAESNERLVREIAQSLKDNKGLAAKRMARTLMSAK